MAHEPSHGETQRHPPPLDRRIADVARRQGNAIAARQLQWLGLTASGIRSRVARGRLHPIHRGVYSVGPVLTPAGRRWAAVLAAGPGAALSHVSAAAALSLRRDGSARFHVTSSTSRRSRRGIVVHHAPLPAAHVTHLDGLPVTTVPRTLLDLADVLSLDALRRTWEEADRLRLLDVRAVEAVLAAANGRRGAAGLARLLGHHLEGHDYTRSEFERDLLALCAGHGLPTPTINPEVEGYEVDAAWPSHRLVVECDSLAFHTTRAAMQRDRERDLKLRLAGWEPVRLTYRQVVHDAPATAAALRTLLRRANAVGV